MQIHFALNHTSICSSTVVIATCRSETLFFLMSFFSLQKIQIQKKHSYCDFTCKSWIWFSLFLLFYFVVFVLIWKSWLNFFFSSSFVSMKISISDNLLWQLRYGCFYLVGTNIPHNRIASNPIVKSTSILNVRNPMSLEFPTFQFLPKGRRRKKM